MTKFPQKGYVQSTTERVNIIIEFSLIKLEWVPNLTLKKILVLVRICPKWVEKCPEVKFSVNWLTKYWCASLEFY